MRERFTHACNSNQLIILARKETYLVVRLLEAKSRETGLKKGLRGGGGGLLLGSLLLGFISNRPPPSFFAYTEISIYSAGVSSLARSKLSIKLILFFEVRIRIEFESRQVSLS